MQSSKQNPNQKTLIKQSMQSIKKTIVPFNQQLLNLQKKIQQVENKNELILQKIHKAYDFKKSKNKVFYDASEQEQDEQQAMRGGLRQNLQLNQVQRERGSLHNKNNQGYGSAVESRQQQVQMREFQSQPRQFQVQSQRKQQLSIRPSIPQIPGLQLSNRYAQQQSQVHYMYPQQQLQRSNSSPQSGNQFTEDMHQQRQSQQVSSREHESYPSPVYTSPQQQQHQYQQQQQQHQQHQQNNSQQQSQKGQQFQSHSNYSDIQRRKRITQNFRRREKDFSDIKSTIEDRTNLARQAQDKRGRVNRHTPKKSFVFSSVENNSSYSQGNLPNKDDIIHGEDDLDIQSPVTNHPYFVKPRSPHYPDSISIPSQQPRNVHIYSTNDIYPQNSYIIPQGQTMSSVPNIPLQSIQMLAPNRLSYQSQTMSQNEINYLTDMYKTERQKTITLQKQLQQKDQNIQHLKMYKKAFRRFRDHTFHLFEEAFDQYVETFLRNRLYKIEKAMRKNENRLAALVMQVKDFKEKQVYKISLRKNFPDKLNKRSYSSLEPNYNNRQNMFQERAQQQAFEQNVSTISNRSGQRSVSARKRRSQDKSVTKKSNHSQHLIMKKEFTNIAENYQSMIKVKNQQIEKYQNELKQTRSTIQVLQEENNRLKVTCQQLQTQIQTQQIQNQLGSSAVDTQMSRRNSGNLRILSRSSSRSQIKKGSTGAQQTQQLQQKLKSYKKAIQKMSEQNSSLENQLQTIHQQHLSCQQEMKQMAERIFEFQQKIVPLKDEKILALQSNITKLIKQCQVLTDRSSDMNSEMEMMRVKLVQKDKKIMELDSAIYMKTNQLKKVQNLLTLKSYKLQEFNKLLMSPSTGEPLNDSISSIIEEPHNRTAFLMLQNLQRQLQEEKHEKQVQFMKLKRSYESRIQQLKIQFQQIVLQNEKLGDKLNAINIKEKQLQDDKEQLTQANQKLKEQIQRLETELAFLNEKNNFYQTQRNTGKTGSFGGNKLKDTIVEHSQGAKPEHLQRGHTSLLKPLQFEQQDFDDFPQIEEQILRRKEKSISISSWKPVSGEIQLLDQSSYNSGYNNKKNPSEQNHFDLKRAGSLNQNMQHKLSTIKDENIQLSQKVAKLQKENNFLKQSQIQLAQKYQDLKNQLTNFSSKYQQLQKNNSYLIRMFQEIQAQKLQLEKEKNELQSHIHNVNSHSGRSPVDWKQVERHIEPVDLKGSGMYSPWSFAEKDDILLDRSAKDVNDNRGSKQTDHRQYKQVDPRKETDIRDSIVSGFSIMNRPSKESRQSLSSTDKKIDQLTKKLSQTQLLLQNKEKINEQLVIGFTKKIDKMTNQHEQQAKQQAKVIEKYIQENSRLRKEKEKLQEQIQALSSSILKQQSVIKSGEKVQQQKMQQNQQNLLQHSYQAEQIDFNDNIDVQQQQNFGMLQQRIQGFNGKGFMLGINNDDQQEQQQKQHKSKPIQSPINQPVRFASILQEQNDGDEIGFDDFEEQNQKITLLEKTVQDLEETIEQLQKFLEESLNKVKQKQQEKFGLVDQLQRKNNQLQQLKDLIQLKETGMSHTLTLSKSINYGHAQRYSIEKSQRGRLNSITSLKYSRTNQGQRKSSFDEQIHFDFLDQSNPNNRSLQHSQTSNMYSENMSMIFDKEENFLEQVRKAKNKRKEEGKLLRKTFEYIKKLRASLNDKNKKIKILEMRIDELKDNCWLWKKNEPLGNNSGNNNNNSGTNHGETGTNFHTNPSGFHASTSPQAQQNGHSYLDPNNQSLALDSNNQSLALDSNNQSLALDQQHNKLVDSRLFECNSQDLNKKKPRRHNHYKKLQYDTKLIVEENKILTKQIEILQQELIKIQEQQNGLMAVKELYKEQIRALNKQNQQLATIYQHQVIKLHQRLQTSQGVHNFQAIKQLFKKIIDNVGVMLYPSTSSEAKKKSANQLKQQKRKQAEQCIKVVCSILNYDQHIRHQLCLRLCGQGQQQ